MPCFELAQQVCKSIANHPRLAITLQLLRADARAYAASLETRVAALQQQLAQQHSALEQQEQQEQQ
jgi:hypothetical protein